MPKLLISSKFSSSDNDVYKSSRFSTVCNLFTTFAGKLFSSLKFSLMAQITSSIAVWLNDGFSVVKSSDVCVTVSNFSQNSFSSSAVMSITILDLEIYSFNCFFVSSCWNTNTYDELLMKHSDVFSYQRT